MTSYGETVNDRFLDYIQVLRGTVLDVGCGAGAWAPDLRKLGASRLLGVEPGDDAASAAKRYDEVVQGTVEDVELPAADVVIAADVIEHMRDPWSALNRIRAAVRPGATLFVSVPNVQYIKALVTIARGNFPNDVNGGFWDRTHLHWFTAGSLRAALDECGWHVDDVRCDVGAGKRGRFGASKRPPLNAFLAHQLFARAHAKSVNAADPRL